jgi:tetratricopeptide (TPR) repeat protein
VPALAAGLALALLLAGSLAWGLRTQGRDQDSAMATLLLAGTAMVEFRAAQLQPPHDLRPARTRVAAHMTSIRARMAKGGPFVQSVGWYALGRCHLLLEDYEEARRDAEKMGTQGIQGLNRQRLRTLAQAGAGCWNPDLGPEATSPAPPLAGEDRDEFLEATGFFNARDYAHAAADARLAQMSYREPADLEAAALCALGRQRYRAGDLAQAQEQYQEARSSAQKRLSVWKSSSSLHHALARATLGLAEVQWERGQDPMPLLKEMGVHSDLALELEPDAPAFLEDWLGTRFLTARYQNALGRDALPGLEGAMTFMATRVKEPAAPALQAARMLIFWQVAEARAQHGQDPGPALLEALRASMPTASFNRDYQGDVLNFKARLEVIRGQDPRPTLDNNLGRLQAGIQATDAWTTLETAAEAWFIRADWEAGKAMDPAASLASLHRMADQALRIYPGAPSSNVLKGLAFSMEIQHDPSRKALLLPAARERLKSAQSGQSAGRLLPKLAHDLSSPT